MSCRISVMLEFLVFVCQFTSLSGHFFTFSLVSSKVWSFLLFNVEVNKVWNLQLMAGFLYNLVKHRLTPSVSTYIPSTWEHLWDAPEPAKFHYKTCGLELLYPLIVFPEVLGSSELCSIVLSTALIRTDVKCFLFAPPELSCCLKLCFSPVYA